MIECYLCGDSFILPVNGEHQEEGWACEECVYVSGLMDEMKYEETQKNEFTLGTITDWNGVEPFQSNDLEVCLDCGIRITKDNDSTWEAFLKDGRTTQKICKSCNVERSEITQKLED